MSTMVDVEANTEAARPGWGGCVGCAVLAYLVVAGVIWTIQLIL